MSFSDDYEDEMGRLGRLSDRDVEKLAAGRTPAGDEGLEDLAGRLRSARAACLAGPDETTEALHIAEITQAARLVAEKREPAARSSRQTLDRPASGPSTWRRRLEVVRSITIKLIAGVAGAMLSTVGFAYAGVDLPGEASEKAFAAVLGVELPNQGEENPVDGPDEDADQTALDVWRVISNWSGERGCAFGQAVASAATGGKNAPDCTKSEGAGSRGVQASARGRATADEASARGRATADEASSDGRSTANRATGGRSETGAETGDGASESGRSSNPISGSGQGPETGNVPSRRGESKSPISGGGAGPETGAAASDRAQSKNPVDSAPIP